MKMKTHIKLIGGFLAAIAFVALCGTAQADISAPVSSATVGSWNAAPDGSSPFYSSDDLTGLSGDGQPAANAGATATVLSETITLTNGAGANLIGHILVGNTNYTLTGIAMIVSGFSATPVSVHIFDVTTNLTSNNGTVLNGSGASYNFTADDDLLGGGNGLGWTNNQMSGAEQQVFLGFQNGPTTQDQIVLGSNHTYAVEIWTPTTASGAFNWFKNATADVGGQAMGSKDASFGVARLTIASLGQVGGAPRTFGLALYGYPTNAAPTANNNTSTNGVVNLIVDRFNPTNSPNAGTNYAGGDITNVWGNWFGSAFSNVVWDPTSDAQGNPNSGSLKITAAFSSGGQYLVTDKGTGANTGPGINPPITNGVSLLTFQCDIRFDPSSPTTVDGSVTNYGHVQFGPVPPFTEVDFGNIEVPVGTTNWVHVSIPINGSNPNFQSISGVFVKIDGSFENGGANPLNGTSILWVDNVQFTASSAPPAPPAPPTVAIQKATPALRIFAGSTANTFDREELATTDENQSWIGGGFPVSYSFTLLDFPANINQTHIFLVPVNTALPNNAFVNQFIEFQASNTLWMVINPGPGTNVTALVQWKTNLPNANPNNTALQITNSTAVGTWKLIFTSASAGTLTAPGGSAMPFTITDPNVMTDFANPVVAYFGLQPNSTTGQGQFEDWGSIIVTGVSGAQENEDFTKESSDFDSTTRISPSGQFRSDSSADAAGVVIVRTNLDQYWVNWTLPALNFNIGSSTNLPASQWINPAFYGNYLDETAPRGNPLQLGFKMWVLLPTDDLPTVDGNPGSALAPNAFFLVSTNVISP
jgi:hypothetical protein